MKIALFSLVKNRLAFTRITIESLARKTHLPVDHFIIDQGSTDGTVDWLKNFRRSGWNIFPYFLPRNIGINKGTNFALDKMENYDIIVKIDNDALIVTDDWLRKCLSVWNKKLVLSPYVMGLLDNRGGINRISYDPQRKIGFTPAVGGICMIGSNKAWTDDSGGMDYPNPIYVPDSDIKFCQRLALKGYQFGYKEDVFLKHMGITTKQENAII